MEAGALPDGETYLAQRYDALPSGFRESGLPFIVPENAVRKGETEGWFVFGAAPGADSGSGLPVRPGDPFAVFGAVPGDPEKTAARLNRTAHLFETGAWLSLLAGIAVNAFLLSLIIFTLNA